MTLTELVRYCKRELKGYVAIDCYWQRHSSGEEKLEWQFYTDVEKPAVIFKSETIEGLHSQIENKFFPKKDTIESQLAKADL